LLQERYRANNPTYGTLVQIGGPAASASGYYTLAIPAAPTATAYSVTATAVGAQASDSKCATMTLAYNNGATSKLSTGGGTCW
jgi:type IV pilus assembly protein PilE